MEDMIAMNYEYLIRRAHQKGRFGTKGANADIFRCLLRNYWEFNASGKVSPPTSSKPNAKLESEYKKKADEVKGYIAEAVDYAVKKYNHKFSELQKLELEQCKKDLATYELEATKEIILRAEKTMLEIGLYPQ